MAEKRENDETAVGENFRIEAHAMPGPAADRDQREGQSRRAPPRSSRSTRGRNFIPNTFGREDACKARR